MRSRLHEDTSKDLQELCPGCAREVKRTSCAVCGRETSHSADQSELVPPGLFDGALEGVALLKDDSASRRQHNRRTVETILKTYSAEEVNWSAVAGLLGISRQAVHQIKRRLMAPTRPSQSTTREINAVPLHSRPLALRAARTRMPTTTAIILAGGSGTRLRPLTLSCRKELIPLLNQPLLAYRLHNLREHGVREVILACSQGTREIEEEFGDGAQFGLNLRYSYEDRPLGSGRAIKHAARALGATGTLVVCNGDILTNINLRAMLRSHHETRASISLSLKPVDDPWHFGVVRALGDLKICEFVEKPTPGSEPSNLVNAGTWLWEPEVLDRIPDDESAIRDGFAERILFPGVIQEGLRVQGFIEDGLWVDVGSPERYLRATELLMSSRPNVHTRTTGGATGVQYVGKSVIGEHVQMGEGVRIIGPSVIGDGCVIGSGSIIDRSVLWENVRVGAGTQFVGSIAANDAFVGDRASVIDAVLGNGARIGDDVHLDVGARMQPGEAIRGTLVRKFGSAQRV